MHRAWLRRSATRDAKRPRPGEMVARAARGAGRACSLWRNVVGVVMVGLAVAGCCGPNHAATRAPYMGPTESLAELIRDINANNSRIPTLVAHHYYEAHIVDEKGRHHDVTGDGALLYLAPLDMRLRANAVAAGPVFDLGSNKSQFWMLAGPQAGDTLWWGRYDDLTRLDPDRLGIPIRPDMVLDVLSISTANTDLTQLPAPVLRVDADNSRYVLTWVTRVADRWVALREVWYDLPSKRPQVVLLYDLKGRVVLRGELDKFRQVVVPGMPQADWPWMPGNYKLTFPDTGSTLVFTLDQAELTNVENGVRRPNPKSFRMPNPENPGVGHVIQIGKPPGE